MSKANEVRPRGVVRLDMCNMGKEPQTTLYRTEHCKTYQTKGRWTTNVCIDE